MHKKVVCIGSVLIDEIYISENEILKGTSNPAVAKRQVGGVITNIARHLSKLGVDVELVTALGDDADAVFLTQQLAADRVKLTHAVSSSLPTGKYVGLMAPDGSLYTAVVTDTIEKVITPDALNNLGGVMNDAELIIADCNLSVASLQWLIHYCRKAGLKLIIEPVSVPKAKKLVGLDLTGVFLLTPNQDELNVIAAVETSGEKAQLNYLMDAGVRQVWLRKGAAGSLFIDEKLHFIELPAIKLMVKDATGAGDAALASWVAAYLNGEDVEICIRAGHALAYEVLQQVGAVVEDLNEHQMKSLIQKYENETF